MQMFILRLTRLTCILEYYPLADSQVRQPLISRPYTISIRSVPSVYALGSIHNVPINQFSCCVYCVNRKNQWSYVTAGKEEEEGKEKEEEEEEEGRRGERTITH